MDEVFACQESIIKSVQEENRKLQNLDDRYKLDEMISKARDYHEKLVNIKKSMLIIKDKTAKLKRKAIKILEDNDREELERQKLERRREMLERHLEPVVNTSNNNS